MWESLGDEFEIDERFNRLQSKVDVIHDNSKFFLDVLGDRKSERLEIYIIALIAAELAFSCMHYFKG